MQSTAIRKRFFDFFEKKGHTLVASSPLIPAHDPTLLFANAGMNQFKDLFLGREKRSYARAVSIQKCMRAGGKHNDLDNVGFTSRHLTFFEMMGNFSFGNYFKKEAIAYAWEFLTQEMSLAQDLLHASVFHEDQESYTLWHTMIGLPSERIHRLGAKDNFWQMGETGPCGPCTELYIDRGSGYGCGSTGCSPACGCDRFLELWNLVFMQYDRQLDGTDVLLKQTGVDTGMGLERLAAVMQHASTIFTTDLFQPIIQAIEAATELQYREQSEAHKAAFHVLCDHIRSTSLLIADGCAPSNEGRGYVLRKIIRRAALFAQKLTNKNIFPDLSASVVATLGSIYPELATNRQLIHTILESEIKKFADNLIRGKAILEKFFIENSTTATITGAQAFKLYDTFGFPSELITILAHERNYTVDMEGFAQHMAHQQEQSGKKTVDTLSTITFSQPITTTFTGYDELETTSPIIALIVDGSPVTQVDTGQECWVITAKSPFFIVGGGQVPDHGWLTAHYHTTPLLEVRFIHDGIATRITTPVGLAIGDEVTATVDQQWRTNAMKNHTATHMLQAALIQLFGKQIKQSGSLVHPNYLRFDFTYHANLSAEDISRVENLVNEKIRENSAVTVQHTTMKSALEHGALAFFGDKYNPDDVRMVMIPNFSTELCGGTHVNRTGDIGVFKITEMTALSAGHRRIVAVTGPQAVTLFQDCFNDIKLIATTCKVQRNHAVEAFENQQKALHEAERTIKQLKKELIVLQIPMLNSKRLTSTPIPLLVANCKEYTLDDLRETATELARTASGLTMLLSTHDGASRFVCTLSAEYATTISLKKLAMWLKEAHSLAGGGTATMIQGTGIIPSVETLTNGIIRWLTEIS